MTMNSEREFNTWEYTRRIGIPSNMHFGPYSEIGDMAEDFILPNNVRFVVFEVSGVWFAMKQTNGLEDWTAQFLSKSEAKSFVEKEITNES